MGFLSLGQKVLIELICLLHEAHVGEIHEAFNGIGPLNAATGGEKRFLAADEM